MIQVKYSRRVTNLLLTYKTNCFDYNKVGCKSRNDCIDKCHLKWSLKNCNSLPPHTIWDRHNDQVRITKLCYDQMYCAEKYPWPDCIEEFYSMKTIIDRNIRDEHGYLFSGIEVMMQQFSELQLKGKLNFSKNDLDKVSYVTIDFGEEPDTIYTHSPLQKPVEFICFIGDVVSLWTGLSVYSIYDYRKRAFNRKPN